MTSPHPGLVPGVGDLSPAYRFTAPALVEAGCSVATTDRRGHGHGHGHGQSDAGFDAHGDAATAGDTTALPAALGEPAVVVGSSMAAGGAVIVAARRPGLVRGLVLIGPFVHPPAGPGLITGLQRAALRVMMAPPQAAAARKAHLPTLNAGTRPADSTQHRDAQVASVERPGYAAAFSATIRTDHALAGRSLAAVTAPTLVVMGEKDADFKDPEAEADRIATTLGGGAVMVPDAGHHPHTQQPEATSAAIVDLLATSGSDARAGLDAATVVERGAQLLDERGAQGLNPVSVSLLDVVFAVLAGHGMRGGDAIDAARFLRSALHGFLALETTGAFELPLDLERSWTRLVDSVVTALEGWRS